MAPWGVKQLGYHPKGTSIFPMIEIPKKIIESIIFHLNLHDFAEKQFQPFHLTTKPVTNPPKKNSGWFNGGDPYNSPI